MNTQEASAVFFIPIILAYLSACGGWLLITRLYPSLWFTPSIEEPERNFKGGGDCGSRKKEGFIQWIHE